MPSTINIDIGTLRNIDAGIKKFTLANDGTVQRQGLWHRFQSMFKNTKAFAQNAQTLDAIRRAIQSDPRFFAQDVQDRAAQLLKSVRTDRAIGASQIKDIIVQLDAISSESKRLVAARAIAAGHIAARGIPDFARGNPEGYTALAQATVTHDEPPEGFGRMDYGARLDDFDRRLAALFARIGDAPGDKELLVGKFHHFLAASDKSGLKAQAQSEAAVDRVRASLDESRALGARFGEPTRAIVLDMLRSIPKPLPNGAVTELVTLGRNLASRCGLASLNANSSAAEIYRALIRFSEGIRGADTSLMIEDGDAALPAQLLVAQSAIESYPADVKRNILEALQTGGGKNVLAFLDSQGEFSVPASSAVANIGLLAERLKTSLGIDNPQEPLDRPAQYDPTTLPPSVLDQFSMPAMASGKAAKPIIDLLEDFPRKLSASDPMPYFHVHMNANAKAQHIANLAKQLGMDLAVSVDGQRRIDLDTPVTSFDKDIDRGVVVTLPDGTTISRQNAKQARDLLTAFVTDGRKTTFADAGAEIKTKVHILMASMNQSVIGIGSMAFNETLDLKKGVSRIIGSGYPIEQTYRLSKDAAGNITIAGSCRKALENLAVDTLYTPISTGPGSFERTEVEITFSAENFHALATANWAGFTNYDAVSATGFNMASPTRHADAAAIIGDAFKFTGSFQVHQHYHLEEMPANPVAEGPASA